MSAQPQSLFDLLPALYRLRDAQLAQAQPLLTPAESAQLQSLQALAPPLSPDQQQLFDQLTAKAARGPLQSLLLLIDEQFALLADDLTQRYDDQFIETCASWVIPYIGDLIGYQLVNGIAPAVASPRAEVADTVSLRRRKGTVLVLEQLARDVTGWGAHAVEFFKHLATAQYVKHVRPDNHYAPDLRRWQAGLYMDGGFDLTAHQIDVRRIAVARGRYNIQNVGIFLWSLNAYGLVRVPATAVDGSGRLFRIGALGADVPLFNNPMPQGPALNTAAQPVNVPDRLRRAVLNQDLEAGAGAAYYGEGRSLALYLNSTELSPYQIRICNLSGADGSWANLPVAGDLHTVCFDPELGRLALVNALASPPAAGSSTLLVQASYFYGFGGDTGGGAYSRSDSFLVQSEASVFPYPDTASAPRYATLQDALNFAAGSLTSAGQAAVEILDDEIYLLPNSPALQINVPAGATIELRAAQGCRPTLLIGAEITVTGSAESTMSLNGLLIGYAPASASTTLPAALLHAPGGANLLGNLELSHCTLLPGSALSPTGLPERADAGVPSLLAESAGLQITIQKSILGALRVNPAAIASLADSILDATGVAQVAYAAGDGNGGGGSLTLQACTVIGKIHAALLSLLSNCIVCAALAPADPWPAALWADRKQQGCVRFSYLPAASTVPPQYECVVQAAGAPQPTFYSSQYGDPGYCKLMPSTDDTIRRGAEDEGEMGAFHFVLAPLRENDLRVRLQEYLPAGLEFGIFYQT
jgi:hypothetical protein